MVFYLATFALTSSDLERSNQGQAYFLWSCNFVTLADTAKLITNDG